MRLLRYFLLVTAAIVCMGSMPAGAARADTIMYGSAGAVTVAILERSYADMTPGVVRSMGRSAAESDRAPAGVGTPAPLPGLLLFAATGLAYLWQWTSKRRPRNDGGMLA
jgi:hypothetical protein